MVPHRRERDSDRQPCRGAVGKTSLHRTLTKLGQAENGDENPEQTEHGRQDLKAEGFGKRQGTPPPSRSPETVCPIHSAYCLLDPVGSDDTATGPESSLLYANDSPPLRLSCPAFLS
jgi:hypothetical protein